MISAVIVSNSYYVSNFSHRSQPSTWIELGAYVKGATIYRATVEK